jgi:hypothetical protein
MTREAIRSIVGGGLTILNDKEVNTVRTWPIYISIVLITPVQINSK